MIGCVWACGCVTRGVDATPLAGSGSLSSRDRALFVTRWTSRELTDALEELKSTALEVRQREREATQAAEDVKVQLKEVLPPNHPYTHAFWKNDRCRVYVFRLREGRARVVGGGEIWCTARPFALRMGAPFP